MKHFILSLMLMFAVGTAAQVDDMYFVPKKSEKNKIEEKSNTRMLTTQERISDDSRNIFDEDEYNRRGYLSSQNNEEAEEYVYDDDEAFNSPAGTVEEDFSYSSRILRFHSPRAVMVSSPWYWDIVYTSGVDSWLVCDDGIYWDVYPTYNYYSSWYYPSWSWSFSFGHWGYYNHYCWNHWYAPVWYGHYFPHNHWHGAHHGYWGGTASFRDNRRPPVIDVRTGQVYASNNRGNRSSGRNKNVLQSGKVNSSRGDVSNEQNNDKKSSYVRTGRTNRTTATGGQRVNSGENNRRRTAVQNNNSSNRSNYRGVTTDNTKRERRTDTQKNTSGSREKVYNRPSSTRSTSRSTNVERSSSNRRSSSSFSSGGSSRSSIGSGGSRSGRR